MTVNIKIVEAAGCFHFTPLEIVMFCKKHCFSRERTYFFIHQGIQVVRLGGLHSPPISFLNYKSPVAK